MPRLLKTSVELKAEGPISHIAIKMPRYDADRLQEFLRRRGFPNRSAFIREAIYQKLETELQRIRRNER